MYSDDYYEKSIFDTSKTSLIQLKEYIIQFFIAVVCSLVYKDVQYERAATTTSI